jgi:hypothetical protein
MNEDLYCRWIGGGYLEDLDADGVHGHHERYECVGDGGLGIEDGAGCLRGCFLSRMSVRYVERCVCGREDFEG